MHWVKSGGDLSVQSEFTLIYFGGYARPPPASNKENHI